MKTNKTKFDIILDCSILAVTLLMLYASHHNRMAVKRDVERHMHYVNIMTDNVNELQCFLDSLHINLESCIVKRIK